MKVLTVFGTRPEAIKMCPLVLKLKENKTMECVVCLSGQHREMLSQVMDVFSVKPDYNLDIMRDKQTLTSITTSVLEKLEPVLNKEKPDMVLVHGDTTTSFAAALAAFYQKIPVGHVEAGLRTGDIYSPFPEEINRLLTDRISSAFFAPTKQNAQNLRNEGITQNIFITGNTVIDAFQYTVNESYSFSNKSLKELNFDNHRVITVTAHRRENLGEPLENICKAIKRVASEYTDVIFIFPVHLNPQVKNTVYELLTGMKNVFLVDPLDVLDMHNLLARCFMVMTDSGGLQEEAPHFGKPVLVLRKETERPEAVTAGTVRIVGCDEDNIYYSVKKIVDDDQEYNNMAKAMNPYGDGHASEKIIKALVGLREKNMFNTLSDS